MWAERSFSSGFVLRITRHAIALAFFFSLFNRQIRQSRPGYGKHHKTSLFACLHSVERFHVSPLIMATKKHPMSLFMDIDPEKRLLFFFFILRPRNQTFSLSLFAHLQFMFDVILVETDFSKASVFCSFSRAISI